MSNDDLRELLATLAQKTADAQAKTDAQFKETDARFALMQKEAREEAEREMRALRKEAQWEMRAIREAQAKTDEQLKKTDEQLKKTDEQLKKTESIVRTISKEYGGFINNAGRETEEFFISALRNNDLRVGELKFNHIASNVTLSKRDETIEVDALLQNGQYIGLLEVKNTLHLHALEKIYTQLLPKFKRILSESAQLHTVVMVAGKVINADALEQAHAYGFITITPDGQVVKIDTAFQRDQ